MGILLNALTLLPKMELRVFVERAFLGHFCMIVEWKFPRNFLGCEFMSSVILLSSIFVSSYSTMRKALCPYSPFETGLFNS